MATIATHVPFLTLGMPDDGADCESCTFRTGTERVYRIKSDNPAWNNTFPVLCESCVSKSDVIKP